MRLCCGHIEKLGRGRGVEYPALSRPSKRRPHGAPPARSLPVGVCVCATMHEMVRTHTEMRKRRTLRCSGGGNLAPLSILCTLYPLRRKRQTRYLC